MKKQKTAARCCVHVAKLGSMLFFFMAVSVLRAQEDTVKAREETQALADYERTARTAKVSAMATDGTNACALALADCEKAASDAETAIQGFACDKNPAVRESCNGVRLVISAIRGLAGAQIRYPGSKIPTADLKDALVYFLSCVKTGKDPFAGMLSGVRPYRSPIDGDILGYEFKLPKDYTPAKKYPLEISLHCSGGFMWRGLMTGLKPTADFAQSSDFRHHGKLDPFDPVKSGERPCIWVHILGRGEASAYTGMGEIAILEALDDIRQHYSVDESRIIIGGASMGGSGGFRLGTAYPDLFAAAYSFTGSGSYGAPTNGLCNAYLRTENLCNTPFCAFDALGDSDSKVNPNFFKRQAALAEQCPGCYLSLELMDPVGSHGTVDAKYRDEGWAWMRKQARSSYPRRVVYKSYDLRHNGAYWAHFDTMMNTEEPVRIEAELVADGKVRVTTSNIERFHLDLPAELVGKGKDVEIVINGQPVRTTAGGTVNFAQVGGSWGVSAMRFPSGLVKKPGSSGPIMDVFMGERVMFVYGTRKEKDPGTRGKMVDSVVTALFGKSDGGMLFHADFPRKADVDVTPADMAGNHLVLLGTPDQNALVARMAGSLPIQFTDDGVKAGGKAFKGAGMIMVYPNPLNPDHYVLLMPENFCNANPDPRELHDYFIGTFGARTRMVAEGTFDSQWRLKP